MRFTFLAPPTTTVPSCLACNPEWTCAEHHPSGIRTRQPSIFGNR